MEPRYRHWLTHWKEDDKYDNQRISLHLFITKCSTRNLYMLQLSMFMKIWNFYFQCFKHFVVLWIFFYVPQQIHILIKWDTWYHYESIFYNYLYHVKIYSQENVSRIAVWKRLLSHLWIYEKWMQLDSGIKYDDTYSWNMNTWTLQDHLKFGYQVSFSISGLLIKVLFQKIY